MYLTSWVVVHRLLQRIVTTLFQRVANSSANVPEVFEDIIRHYLEVLLTFQGCIASVVSLSSDLCTDVLIVVKFVMTSLLSINQLFLWQYIVFVTAFLLVVLLSRERQWRRAG